MPPKIDDILMSETTRIIVNLGSSLLLAIATAILGWMFRGKRESRKLQLEIEQFELLRRKEELQFREQLMAKVNELQKKVFELERLVSEQAEELNDLKAVIADKDEQIKNLKND